MPPGLLFASLFWPAHPCQYCHPGNSGGTWPGLRVWLESPQQSGHLQLSAAGLRPSARVVGRFRRSHAEGLSGSIFILKSVLRQQWRGCREEPEPCSRAGQPCHRHRVGSRPGNSVPPQGGPGSRRHARWGRTFTVSGRALVSFILPAPPPSETVVCMEGTLILCDVRQRQTTASQEQLAGFSSLKTE